MNGHCRSCGAPARFPLTHKGHKAIFNLDPHPKGNRVVRFLKGVETMLPPDDPRAGEVADDEPRYLDHHADCPSAKAWAKSRRDSKPAAVTP